MKIGFDISQTGSNKAGCGYYADNLIKSLANIDRDNQYFLYRTFGDHFWGDKNSVVTIKQENFNLGLEHSNLNAAQNFWDNFSVEKEKQLRNIDIIHCNNYFCPPKLSKTKIIYTLYDLSFLSHPEYTTEENRLACFHGVFNASVNADHIVAISNYSRQNFLENFPHSSPEKISVIYPASRFIETYKNNKESKNLSKLIPKKFWLNVGTIEPRKNFNNLLLAYAQYKKMHENPLPLVFAGAKGWMSDNFEEMLVQLRLTDDVMVLGYVTDDELMWLYKNCFCLLYPSYFEGFGLPVLEAMSLGAAVITSNVSSIPEVVENSGILVNPNNYDEIATAMNKLVNDASYCENLRMLSKQQAQKFSWINSAKNILQLYQRIITEPQARKKVSNMT